MRRLFTNGFLLVLSVPMPFLASAQERPPKFEGTVVDVSGSPVALADVIAIGHTRQTEGPHHTRTNDAGRFVFRHLESGTYTVTVRRIGFIPIQVAITLTENPQIGIRIEIHRMPQVLADLVVVEAADLAAQNASLFQGLVVDSKGRPIPDAEVVAGGAGPRIRGPHLRRSDAQGRFLYSDFQPGRYFVTVRRIGYVPIHVALTFESRVPRAIRFEMQVMPQHLADVEVYGEGFDSDRIARRIAARGYRGTLLTRDDLERIAPRVLGDAIGRTLTLVRRETFSEPNLGFSGLWTRAGNDPLRLIGAEQRGRDCPPWISVNGARIRPGWAVNDFDPNQVEAVEIYKGPWYPYPFDSDPHLTGGVLQGPLSRNSFSPNCGQLVVIWLKPGVVIQPGQ